jgi:hypothetical protein|tara:strand:- start:115 stop:504 length:390 start_codon:yes stop_codon:yes gene_type:complete
MSNLLNNLIGPVSGVLDKFVADKDLKAKLEHELKTELHKANMAQIEVNKIEAQSRHWFVASWRPFVGWVCAFALAYHFVFQPIMVFAISLYGVTVTLPEFDMGSLMTILMGMLGLGGLRTWEKNKGVTK